jgi:hypothetical protein
MTNVRSGHKGFVSRPLEDRFWEKVVKTDDCWLWVGSRAGGGYGRIRVNGKHVPAHRVSWSLQHGIPFPEHLDACHHCDNPLCVRPDHIFPGTPSENAIDARDKGRLKDWSLCSRGHPMTGGNVCQRADGCRECRMCRNVRKQKARAKAKASRAALSAIEKPA